MHNTTIKILFLVLCINLLTHDILAQSEFSSGILPKFTLSSKLSNRTKLINAVESRQVFIDDTEENSFQYSYILTDLTSLISTKIGAHGVLNGGYLFRIKDDEIIHRTIQQYNYVQLLHVGRIGHRLATDQTFTSNEAPEFRLRYRVTYEKPLSGEQIDSKEFYLKFSNEYLGSYQQDETDLEIRLLPFLGYEFNRRSKTEFGLDYRISNFFNSDTKHKLWVSIHWLYTIDIRKKK
ncbi:DUF2490 domain-containing protein [Aquimarina algiphila]|uniref:DUF2490 domain-containing protein n=1 Tax=Aquimarina algiphila TaxID=2047982 RepID=UPI0024924FBA|nr:DUF2490 domain-containing protein [Aquimarina algiphila]